MYYITKYHDGSVPILDFGMIVSLVMVLYIAIPTVGFLFLREGNLALMGFRVSDLEPKFSEVNRVLLNAVSVLFGIISAYKIWFRGNSLVAYNVKSISSNILSKSILGLLITGSFILIIKLKFGLFEVKSYNESYTAFWELPKGVKQLMIVFQDAFKFCKIVIVIYLFQKYRFRWKLISLIYLFLTFLFFDFGGSRTSLFVELLLIAALYNLYIEKLSKAKIVIFAVLGLMVFSFIGIIRAESNEIFTLSNYLLIGEFVNVWANAIHVSQLVDQHSLYVPLNVRLSEVLSFIPSQILPFEKNDYAIWYMQTYFSESLEQGNGLAFGIVAQSISDGSALFGFLRGFILGGIFIFSTRLVKSAKFWWALPVYLTLYLGIYSIIRSTSFEIFSSYILKLIVIVFLLMIPWSSREVYK